MFQVSASRLQSKYSKRKVKLRNVRARPSLLPASDLDEDKDVYVATEDESYLILPIETEKEFTSQNKYKWTAPSYTLKPTSHFLLANRGLLNKFEGENFNKIMNFYLKLSTIKMPI